MGYIIIGRNPNSKRLIVVEKEDAERPDMQEIAEYDTENEAEKTALRMPIFKVWPYQVVEVKL